MKNEITFVLGIIFMMTLSFVFFVGTPHVIDGSCFVEEGSYLDCEEIDFFSIGNFNIRPASLVVWWVVGLVLFLHGTVEMGEIK